MKQDKFIKKCGPFKVSSISQDGQGVRLVVYPAFPEYEGEIEEHWAVSRIKGQGGGPSIFTAIGLATHMEKFLNQPYEETAITEWGIIVSRLMGFLHKKQKHDRKIQKKSAPS